MTNRILGLVDVLFEKSPDLLKISNLISAQKAGFGII